MNIQKASKVPPSASVRTIEIAGTLKQRVLCEQLIRSRLADLSAAAIEREADPLAHLTAGVRSQVDQLHSLTGCPLLACARALEASKGDAEAAAEKLLLSFGGFEGGAGEGGASADDAELAMEIERVQALSLASARAEEQRQQQADEEEAEAFVEAMAQSAYVFAQAQARNTLYWQGRADEAVGVDPAEADELQRALAASEAAVASEASEAAMEDRLLAAILEQSRASAEADAQRRAQLRAYAGYAVDSAAGQGSAEGAVVVDARAEEEAELQRVLLQSVVQAQLEDDARYGGYGYN